MQQTLRGWLAGLILGGLACAATAQVPAKPTSSRPTEKVPAPATNARSDAVTVNGEPILEGAIQRFLRGVPTDQWNDARPKVLNHLTDNVLVDQYLKQAGLKVEDKDIDAKIADLKKEIEKEKLDYAKFLQEMEATEAELRYHLAADLRWEKYVNMQSTDKVLREQFASQKEVFDGSMVRVRHILLTPPTRDAAKVAATKAALADIRKDIESKVTAGLAKLPASTDNLAREKARTRLLEDAFADWAKKKSDCPSKQNGGDVGWRDRISLMVEPFGKVAFGLKSFEMSDIVETEFGFHLILLLDRRPGKDVKFEDVKDNVKEFYAEKLRNLVVQHMRRSAKIVVSSK